MWWERTELGTTLSLPHGVSLGTRVLQMVCLCWSDVSMKDMKGGFLTTMLYDVIGFKWDLFFSDNFQCSHVNLFTFSRLWTANVTNYKMMQQSEGELSPRGLRYIRHRVGLGCQKSMKIWDGKVKDTTFMGERLLEGVEHCSGEFIRSTGL